MNVNFLKKIASIVAADIRGNLTTILHSMNGNFCKMIFSNIMMVVLQIYLKRAENFPLGVKSSVSLLANFG